MLDCPCCGGSASASSGVGKGATQTDNPERV